MAVSYTLLLYLVFTFQLPHLMMSTEHQVRVYMTDVWFLAKKLLYFGLDLGCGSLARRFRGVGHQSLLLMAL